MFGNAILDLMGQKDPKLALLQAMQGGTPASAGGAGDSTYSAATGGGGTAAPAQAAPQPEAYQSPPQIMELYQQLIERQQKAQMIDRGIGMMAQGAMPDSNVGQWFNGSSGGGAGANADPMAMIKSVMEIQNTQKAAAAKAAQRAAIPALAKQYGLSVEAASYLFDTGKLDTVITEASKPDNQIVTQADGTSVIVNKATGEIGEAFGPKKAREIEITSDDSGNKFAVYKDTGERVGTANIAEGMGATNDEKLWRRDNEDRKARGMPERSLSEFLQSNNQSRAGAANVGPSGINYGDPPKDMVWKRDETGNIIVGESGAPVAIPVQGGPSDNNQKEALRKGQKELTGGIVTDTIDRALGRVEAKKGDWVGNTGMAGAVLQVVPGTDAYTLARDLDTIKSNIGFDKLQEMRAASPTGGALGQVSDFENKLLQSTFGSLEQGQEPADLKRNLARVRRIYSAVVNGEMGPINPNTGEPDPAKVKAVLDEANAAAADDISDEDLIKQYLGNN